VLNEIAWSRSKRSCACPADTWVTVVHGLAPCGASPSPRASPQTEEEGRDEIEGAVAEPVPEEPARPEEPAGSESEDDTDGLAPMGYETFREWAQRNYYAVLAERIRQPAAWLYSRCICRKRRAARHPPLQPRGPPTMAAMADGIKRSLPRHGAHNALGGRRPPSRRASATGRRSRHRDGRASSPR
jgi:hypothetical protein